jgi:hypothetical protein
MVKLTCTKQCLYNATGSDELYRVLVLTSKYAHALQRDKRTI